MKTLKGILILATMTTMIACGKGFKSNQPSFGGDGSNNSQGGVDNSATWAKVEDETNSAISGGEYAGQLVVRVNREAQTLDLTLPLPILFSGMSSEISAQLSQQLPGSSIHTINNPDGSQDWVVSIPLRYVLRGANLIPFNTLPNGMALPYLPAGEMRGIALQFPQKPKYRMHIYVSVNAAAVFIETPDWELPEQINLLPVIPVRNANNTRVIGAFKLIGSVGTFSSGVYLAARLPSDIARMLNDIVQL